MTKTFLLGASSLLTLLAATPAAAQQIDHEDEDHHGEAFTVGKVSAGAIRDFQIAPQVKLGVGGLVAVNSVPEGLRAEYGKARPLGGMAFVRLKVG